MSHTCSRVHSLAKFRRGEAQRLGKPRNVFDSEVAATAFDVADVGGVKTGFLGQLLLREFAGFPLPAYIQPEGGKDIVWFRHDS